MIKLKAKLTQNHFHFSAYLFESNGTILSHATNTEKKEPSMYNISKKYFNTYLKLNASEINAEFRFYYSQKMLKSVLFSIV